MQFASPFVMQTSTPGKGVIHLALLPPDTPRLRTISYQYPLKLVSPAPLHAGEGLINLVHTVYLLTYGGGLVAGDGTDVKVQLDTHVRLILLTQGTTKIFKSPSRHITSSQRMCVSIESEAALCYLPDPVQPFRESAYEQRQIYHVKVPDHGGEMGSLCVLDWVCNGRPANGENWSFYRYSSCNELYLVKAHAGQKLVVRDSMVLSDSVPSQSLAYRMHGIAVYGTLILYGPKFQKLGKFFMREFQALSRIGGRNWDTGDDDKNVDVYQDPSIAKRVERQLFEVNAGLLWSAASVRGCVLVKFGAPELEAARRWLRTMLMQEESVAEIFGERAFLCL